MSSPLALGWDVLVARNGYSRVGRLLCIDDCQWTTQSAFIGYDTNQSAHDVLLAAVVLWLCAKASGASVLIVAANSSANWGSEFQAGLARLGHSGTITGLSSGLNGYSMGDFDFTCMYDLVGGEHALIDPYLDAGGAILSCTESAGINPAATWARYGFQSSQTTNQTFAPGPLYNRPMTCLPLGASPFDKVVATSPTYVTATKTRPGTTTFHYNDLAEPMAATWENA